MDIEHHLVNADLLVGLKKNDTLHIIFFAVFIIDQFLRPILLLWGCHYKRTP